MTQPDPQSLPLAQRLALSYTPVRWRSAVLALLLLDNRLAAILRQGGEPVIAQIKLAWWRDRLGENPDVWPSGEPLLQALRQWPAAAAQLLPLVNGWEALLAEELTLAAIEDFAQGRALAWAALVTEAPEALAPAREWALADLALNLGETDEAGAVRRLVLAGKPQGARLPRSLRTLAVLRALSRRALERGNGDLLDGPAAGLLALRIGLTGR
jgi:15-cis-phytoene synthase